MSTGAIVGYTDEYNVFRGTSVNFDGDLVGDELNQKFRGDREALVEWVERGIRETGYRDTSTKEYYHLWMISEQGEVLAFHL